VAPSNDAGEALRATYAVLEQLAVDERIAFVLRFIEGMELKEGAVACSVSLATFKRRLARAEERFTELARSSPVLRDWLEGGSRWGEQKIR
jgi:RNA polymerase sigma-70 factor (ECF subfamily)